MQNRLYPPLCVSRFRRSKITAMFGFYVCTLAARQRLARFTRAPLSNANRPVRFGICVRNGVTASESFAWRAPLPSVPATLCVDPFHLSTDRTLSSPDLSPSRPSLVQPARASFAFADAHRIDSRERVETTGRHVCRPLLRMESK